MLVVMGVLYVSELIIQFTFTSQTATSLNNWFSSHGWTLTNEGEVPSYGFLYYWEKDIYEASCVYMTITNKAGITIKTDNDLGTVPGWLPNNVLAEYGLSGMPAVEWTRLSSVVMSIGLGISYRVEVANDSSIQNWLTSNGYILYNSWVANGTFIWQYRKGNFHATYTRLARESEYDDDSCQITIARTQ